MGLDILYTVLSYPPAIGGRQSAMHALAREMAGAGHRATVIAQWPRKPRSYVWGSTVLSGPPRSYVWEGVPVRQLGFPLSRRAHMAP